MNPFFRSLTVIANGPIDSKPVLKGLYLRFLERENHLPISDTLYAATQETGNIRLMEIKGASEAAQVIEFPREEETFCFAYQFIGNSVITASGSWPLKWGQHIGCRTHTGERLLCRIDRGKTWILLISISGEALQAIRSEFPTLAHKPRSPLTIGYRQKNLFDKVQQLKGGAYSVISDLAKYVEIIARGNQTIILSAGFRPTKDPSPDTGVNPKAENFTVEPRGLGTLQVTAKVAPWEKVRYYQFEYRKKEAGAE
ncbi:hypothetical protein [Parapedobacter soli]|uniref:hypothetical protein n=1 Tax=Parapedobacter soli TaxID=416955 RepID=UPI0021C60DAA|nr:hypothetical protein [Parapedobacter soli]